MAKRTSRANSRELKKFKAYLLSRDGNYCKICKNEFPPDRLVIDHIDNDYTNRNLQNLQLICQSHNIMKNPPYKSKRDIDNVCVSVDEEPKPQSAEMARNIKSEPLFREWLNKEMKKKLRMDLNDIIDSGAEYAEVSVDTVRNRYLRKLTSRIGPYKIAEERGVKILEWKPQYFPFKDEIKKWTE